MTGQASGTLLLALTLASFAWIVPDSPAEAQHEHHGAHVHGIAQLNVALDGESLYLEFVSPAANIVGFEYDPSTQAERDTVESALEILENAESIFLLPSGVGAELVEANAVSDAGHDAHEHDHGAHDHDGHAHHEHDHSDESVHTHEHDHSGDHAHSHEHDPSDGSAHSHEHDHSGDHAHSHEHDHSDGSAHSHEHDHSDESAHSHEHDHTGDHAHSHDHASGEHAHSHEHDHSGEHAHAHDHHHDGGAHRDFKAVYLFNCKNVDKLNSIEVRLFELFPAIEKIDVQILTEAKQTATELTASKTTIRF